MSMQVNPREDIVYFSLATNPLFCCLVIKFEIILFHLNHLGAISDFILPEIPLVSGL